MEVLKGPFQDIKNIKNINNWVILEILNSSKSKISKYVEIKKATKFIIRAA
jgi:RNA polymerase subunit RPABC4/transcription elongation factor Spt4